MCQDHDIEEDEVKLISKGKAVSILQGMYDRADRIHESTDGDDWVWEDMKALQFAIDTIRERKEGQNLKAGYPSLYKCSECGWECWDTIPCDTETFNFCPHCGARMKGE